MVTYAGAGAERRWATGPTPPTGSVYTLHDEIEYAGRYTDFLSALQYNRARWYSPATGQFMARDSLGYAAGDTNLYRYAANSFTNGTDPSGHVFLETGILAGIGFAAGFFLGGYDKQGNWNSQKAVAFGISGAMIGAGIGLSLTMPGHGGILGGSTLIGAGMGGLASQGNVKSGFDWGAWGKGTVVGGAGAALAVGLGMVAGPTLFGAFAAGYVGAFATQTLQRAAGLRDRYDGLGMLIGGLGSTGGTITQRIANAPFQNASGLLSCQATRTVGQRLAYHLTNAVGGGASAGATNALEQWARGGPFDAGEFFGAVGLGAAHSGASARARLYAKGGRVCFAAGTPLLTPSGSKRIEEIRVGDLVLSRDESDPEGVVLAKVVEEVFVRAGFVLSLHVGGQVIRTTAEHPFWVRGQGWIQAHLLQPGDLLSSHDGRWVPVEEVFDTCEYETVYNLRVGAWHTYFVGCQEWGWSVWAHNTGCNQQEMFPDDINQTGPRNRRGNNPGASKPAARPDEHRTMFPESEQARIRANAEQEAQQQALNEALATPLDPRVRNRPDPARSLDSRELVDPATHTATGYPRDNIKGWELWLAQHPEHLSPANAQLINGINPRTGNSQPPRSPRIDDHWLQFFPEHRGFRNEDLWLHHAQWRNPATGQLENGPYLQAVPQPTHTGQEAHWHGNLP